MLAAQELKGEVKKAPKKGMQLGKPKAKSNALVKELEKLQVIQKEEGQAEAGGQVAEEEKQAENFNPLTENIQLEIDERITCQIAKDGDIEKYELKGILYMTLTDPKKCRPEIQMSYNDFKGVIKVHPEIDKQSWNKHKILKSKDDNEGISTQTKLDALKYRYTSKGEEDLPFTINVFNSKK